MKSHHKLYAAVLFLAVVLHYLAVAIMSSKVGPILFAFYAVVVLLFACVVWAGAGFDSE